MSLLKIVAAMVYDRGSATADELESALPGYSKKQIMCAMKHARGLSLIHCLERAPKFGKTGAGMNPARHYPGEKPPRPRRIESKQPIASVWELGTPRAIPMPQERGRIFNLLGGWTD